MNKTAEVKGIKSHTQIMWEDFTWQYHFPVSNYHSHYPSRKATEDTIKLYCACSRETGINKVIYSVCRDSYPIMEGAAEAKIL